MPEHLESGGSHPLAAWPTTWCCRFQTLSPVPITGPAERTRSRLALGPSWFLTYRAWKQMGTQHVKMGCNLKFQERKWIRRGAGVMSRFLWGKKWNLETVGKKVFLLLCAHRVQKLDQNQWMARAPVLIYAMLLKTSVFTEQICHFSAATEAF